MNYGITFSNKYCKLLGIDPQETLESILKTFKFKVVRLCAYWDQIEDKPGQYDYSELDWQMEICAKYEVEVIIAVGRKVPHYPEFHEPEWALSKDLKFLNEQVLKFTESTIKKYKDFDNISAWQIENEPFWSFGHGKFQIDEEAVKKQAKLARKLDPKRVIILTDTAEWSDWKKPAKYADSVGINVYKIWYKNDEKAYNYNNFEPEFYNDKINGYEKPVFIAELQAEAWGPQKDETGPSEIKNLSKEEYNKSMSPDKLKTMIELANGTDAEFALLWGAEWWYYLKTVVNDDTMWNAGKQLI